MAALTLMESLVVRTLIIIALTIAAFGCATNGRVVDSQDIEYSEYFQCLIYSKDNMLSFDAFITLGKERLPKAYVLTQNQERYLASPDTTLSVNEVYIRNHSDTSTQISQLAIGEGIGNFSRKYQPEIIEVVPGSVFLSKPIVDVTSIYGPTELPCNIRYKSQGKPYALVGKWKRLTISELKH